MKRIVRSACLAVVLVTAMLAVPAAHATSGRPSTAACSLGSTNGTVTKMIGFRNYLLHVPAGLSGPQVPLLLDLHGGGGNGQAYEFITGWSKYADAKKNFIVAYPNSMGYGFWNYGEGSYEVEYLRDVVDHIAATYCIDPKRVFVDGHSNGGLMADRLACDAADKFAAFAPYAGSSAQASIQPTGSGGCSPSRPVPIAFFHGDSDSAAPISYQKANRDWWLAHNGCSTTPTRTTDTYGFLDAYGACDGGADIWWRELKAQNHDWPTGAEGEDQRNRMWAFFDAHPLP